MMLKSVSLLALVTCGTASHLPAQSTAHPKLVRIAATRATGHVDARTTATSTNTPAASLATPDSLENPAVTALTSTIYTQMRAGKIDQAMLTPALSDGLSPDTLAQNRPVFDKLGTPLRFSVEHREVILTGTKYDYLATFANEQMHVRVFVTPEGKVAGYDLGLAR